MSDTALDRMLPQMLADDVLNPDRLPHGHHVKASPHPDHLTAPARGSSGRPDHLHATRQTMPVSHPDRTPIETPQHADAAPAERASHVGSIETPRQTTAAPPVTQSPSRIGPSTRGGQMAVPHTQAPSALHALLTLMLTEQARPRTVTPMHHRPAPPPILSSIKVTR